MLLKKVHPVDIMPNSHAWISVTNLALRDLDIFNFSEFS